MVKSDTCGTIDIERDHIESALLHAVDSLRLPCLGICRGLQFMNVHNGGTLHAHLPDVLGTNAHRAGTEGNSRDTLHTVIAGSNAEIFGIQRTSEVISHHHQGINQLGTGLEAWAYASDGLIEGKKRGFSFYIQSNGIEACPINQPLVEPFFISMRSPLNDLPNQKDIPFEIHLKHGIQKKPGCSMQPGFFVTL